MKKIISILACVCLLLSAMVIPVSAAETTATISFADASARVEWDTTHQIWQQNGIKITNNKASSTSDVVDGVDPAKFYAHSELIIEYPSMTKIVAEASGSKYVFADTSVLDVDATITVSGTTTTITFAAPVDKVTVSYLAKQWRATSMTVYAEAAAGACTHEETTATSNGDETHTVVCNTCGATVNAAADCVDSNKDGACDICTGAVALPFDPTGKTPAEIVDAAYALEVGESFETNATLTGVITAINTPYSDQHGNVTVTIAVEGKEDKPIECYRLAGEGADTITIKDTITVTGILKNYNGKIEFDQGCTLDAVVKGDFEVVVPEDPKEIVDAAFALEAGSSLLYKATLQGEVVEINTPYDEGYGNVTLTISVEGTDGMKDLLCYRLKAGEGADASTVKVGDIIEVTGNIKNFNGTIEYDSGCTFVMIKEYVEETFEGTDPDAPIELAVNTTTPATLKEIKVPAEGTVFVKAADANGIFHVTSTTGTCMLINGRANQVEISDAYDLTLCGYEMVNIYNAGEETVTLYVFLEAGAGEVVGTWDNPEVLELQENPFRPNFPPSAQAQTNLEAGNQGYFYVITATADGAFAVSITANDAEYNDLGYQFSVTNNTTNWQSDLIERAAGADDYYDTVMIPVKAGDELLINAGTFNAEDVWNAPAGTLNVNINFATVGSYEYPVVLEETGDYAATVEAGSQGYYYEWIVEADGTVTVTMNDESGWQYSISKVPVDVDDYSNYYNSDTHWYNDDPVVATETVDVKAGETIQVWVNTYDAADEWNSPAGTVNWTLSWSKKVSNSGVFSMADAEAYAGKEFTVAIDISNNPGIISAVLDVVYDKDVLELVKAEAGDFNNKTTSLEEEVDCYFFSEDFSRINWVDALAAENCTANGTFAILTFKVKEGATGETQISINFDADNVFNKDFENVEFTATAATITIKEGMPGDVNGDGSVDNKDYALLMQHLNGWDVEIDLGVADVNGDGSVDNKDYALLMQFLNGWDVELK